MMTLARDYDSRREKFQDHGNEEKGSREKQEDGEGEGRDRFQSSFSASFSYPLLTPHASLQAMIFGKDLRLVSIGVYLDNLFWKIKEQSANQSVCGSSCLPHQFLRIVRV